MLSFLSTFSYWQRSTTARFTIPQDAARVSRRPGDDGIWPAEGGLSRATSLAFVAFAHTILKFLCGIHRARLSPAATMFLLRYRCSSCRNVIAGSCVSCFPPALAFAQADGPLSHSFVDLGGTGAALLFIRGGFLCLVVSRSKGWERGRDLNAGRLAFLFTRTTGRRCKGGGETENTGEMRGLIAGGGLGNGRGLWVRSGRNREIIDDRIDECQERYGVLSEKKSKK